MTKFNFNEALKHSQQSQNSIQNGFFWIEITVHGKIKDKKKHRKHIRLTPYWKKFQTTPNRIMKSRYGVLGAE